MNGLKIIAIAAFVGDALSLQVRVGSAQNKRKFSHLSENSDETRTTENSSNESMISGGARKGQVTELEPGDKGSTVCIAEQTKTRTKTLLASVRMAKNYISKEVQLSIFIANNMQLIVNRGFKLLENPEYRPFLEQVKVDYTFAPKTAADTREKDDRKVQFHMTEMFPTLSKRARKVWFDKWLGDMDDDKLPWGSTSGKDADTYFQEAVKQMENVLGDASDGGRSGDLTFMWKVKESRYPGFAVKIFTDAHREILLTKHFLKASIERMENTSSSSVSTLVPYLAMYDTCATGSSSGINDDGTAKKSSSDEKGHACRLVVIMPNAGDSPVSLQVTKESSLSDVQELFKQLGDLNGSGFPLFDVKGNGIRGIRSMDRKKQGPQDNFWLQAMDKIKAFSGSKAGWMQLMQFLPDSWNSVETDVESFLKEQGLTDYSMIAIFHLRENKSKNLGSIRMSIAVIDYSMRWDKRSKVEPNIFCKAGRYVTSSSTLEREAYAEQFSNIERFINEYDTNMAVNYPKYAKATQQEPAEQIFEMSSMGRSSMENPAASAADGIRVC